eukprot:7943507-Ditylum_brightwellii.AAC.1
MRTAKERPPAKPSWTTPTSIAHPLHSHSPDHTPIVTVNQENQTKDVQQLHHLTSYIVLYNPRHQNPFSITLHTPTLPSHNNIYMHTHFTCSSPHGNYH